MKKLFSAILVIVAITSLSSCSYNSMVQMDENITVDPTKLTPETIQKSQAAQGQFSTALGRLLVASEKYPELKANENFTALQTQLESTENRINVARLDFNQAVQDYNSKIRSFPANITAKMFGFTEKGYFQAEAGANKVPTVQF